jgi:tripartite-type tricarboxylate transporter receptor subunit TctC
MHKPTRRILLGATLGLAVPAILGRAAFAQDSFPNRPITLVNPYPPGGATDFGARLIAARMETELGQSIVVENRPGAGTAVANSYVAGQRPDGYTLIMATTSLAVIPALQPNVQPRDPRSAFTPIGTATSSPFVLHVNPEFPARTTAELIEYAKANPGKMSWGSSGIGAINHMALELFRAKTGIDVVHIPYRGGAPALLDLHAGRIQAMFQAAQEAVGSVRDGRTRAIAITSKARIPLMQDVPTVAETLPGFEVVFWQGLFGPAGMPEQVVTRLGTALQAATSDPTIRQRLADQGIDAWTGDAALLRQTLAEDTETWGKVIRDQNIRLD